MIMFCKNCGKDIGEAKFCQYCGSSNDDNTNITVNLVQKDFIKTVKEKIALIGREKLIKLTAIIAAIINVIIRVANNEIEVVYSLLAQDDYFVVSDTGRKYMLIVIAIQVIVSALLYSNAKKSQIAISKKATILSVVSITVQLFAMLLRLPAPY